MRHVSPAARREALRTKIIQYVYIYFSRLAGAEWQWETAESAPAWPDFLTVEPTDAHKPRWSYFAPA